MKQSFLNNFNIHEFVVMPNHLHGIIQIVNVGFKNFIPCVDGTSWKFHYRRNFSKINLEIWYKHLWYNHCRLKAEYVNNVVLRKEYKMSPLLVFCIVVIYFSVLIFISYLTSRNADDRTFFTGNRRSPWFIVAFGMIGATLSGVTFISVPGMVKASSFSYFQMILGNFAGHHQH